MVDPTRFGTEDNPFLSVSIINQPSQEDVVAVRVDYILPSDCISQTAQFITTDNTGEVKTDLWLRTDYIKNGKTHYLMNSLEKRFLNHSRIKLNFDDGKYPVSNTYSYEVILSDIEIT